MIQLLFGPILNAVNTIVDKIFPDANKREEVKAQMQAQILQADWSKVEAQMKIIIAEASGNFLQRSWRPILMLTIVAIVANNYLIYPYLNAMFNIGLVLTLPADLYDLMKIGVGGYVVGRSAETISKNYFAAKEKTKNGFSGSNREGGNGA